MSTAPAPQPEFEFNVHQNELIGGLAYRMSGVGFVFFLLGLLHIVYAVSMYMLSKDPAGLAKAAEAANVPIEALRPTAVLTSSIVVGIVGLVYMLVGSWTRQAATGFYGIVRTRGQDVTRLMEALTSLREMYGLIYNIMLLAVLTFFASIAYTMWQNWAR